jgi:hypothetical protein
MVDTEASENASYFTKSTRQSELINQGQTPTIKRPILISVGRIVDRFAAFKIGRRHPNKVDHAANLRARNRLPEEGTNKRSPSETKNKSMAPSTGHKLRTSLMASAISGSVACGSSALICISIASRR